MQIQNSESALAETQRSGWTPRNLELVLALAIFLVALCLRFVYMRAGLLHCDEVILAQALDKSLATHELHGAVGGRYGAVLLNLLAYIPAKAIFGASSEGVILWVAVFFGGCLSVALAQLYRELFGSLTGAFLAGIFFATARLPLVLGTGAKENTAQTFFFVLSLILAARGARGGNLAEKIAAFAAFAFAATVHESTLVMAPVFLIFWLFCEREILSRAKRLLAEVALFCAVLSVPLFLYLGKVVFRTLSERATDLVAFNGIFSETLKYAASELVLSAGLPLVALAALGIVATYRRPRIIIPLAAWASVFFYFGNLNSYSTRYLLFPLLAILLFAAEGGRVLCEWVSEKRQMAALAALALVVSAFGVVTAHPLLSARAKYCGPKELARLAGKLMPPSATIVTMDLSPFFEYYGGLKTMTHPVFDPNAIAAFVQKVRAKVASGEAVYIDDSAFTYDERSLFSYGVINSLVMVRIGGGQGEGWNGNELEPDPFEDNFYKLELK